MSPHSRRIVQRAIVTAACLGLWFWTQSVLGSRPARSAGIGDGLHQVTAAQNEYFHAHAAAADALLIFSSALIDGLALFLLGSWLLGRTVRPFLGLVILMVLRQCVQGLTALPPPPGMIWHYPGFPSLLVTYSVASDFFFSGHTAIAVFAATELARLKKLWLTLAGVFVVFFEIATVIVLRAHYTMDVVAGVLAALCVAALVGRLCVPIERRLSS